MQYDNIIVNNSSIMNALDMKIHLVPKCTEQNMAHKDFCSYDKVALMTTNVNLLNSVKVHEPCLLIHAFPYSSVGLMYSLISTMAGYSHSCLEEGGHDVWFS